MDTKSLVFRWDLPPLRPLWSSGLNPVALMGIFASLPPTLAWSIHRACYRLASRWSLAQRARLLHEDFERDFEEWPGSGRESMELDPHWWASEGDGAGTALLRLDPERQASLGDKDFIPRIFFKLSLFRHTKSL